MPDILWDYQPEISADPFFIVSAWGSAVPIILFPLEEIVVPTSETGVSLQALLLQVKEISYLGRNDSVGGAREKVLLGAAIEIGQSIVVSSFYNEIACLGA